MAKAILLRRYSANVIIGFDFVTPLTGVWLANLMLSEPVTWQLLAGLVTVVCGLFLINKK
jgi:drug/metabolite transporter (DMT)-like permease